MGLTLARRCVAVPVLVAATFLLGLPAWASTFSVTGRVSTASGDGIAGAALDLRVAGQSAVVATSTTDVAGDFAFGAVDEGSYDVTVTPPTESGFRPTTVRSLVVDGDETLNVVLVDSGSSTLSGVVRGRGGVPLTGVDVSLSGPGGGSGRSAGDGSYSVLVSPPGIYTLSVTRGVNDQSLPFVFRVGGEEVDLSQGSVVADVTVPLLSSEVEVLGPDGAPVVGAQVETRLVEPAPVDLVPGGSTSVVGPPDLRDVDQTGSDGVVRQVLLAAQSATVTVTPPAGSGLAAKTVTAVPVTDGGHVVVTLDQPVSLSGVVRGRDGAPLAGVGVGLSGPSGSFGATSGADGSYSVLVSPAGIYTLGVARGVNDRTLPFVFQVSGEEVDLSQGSVVDDVTLPFLDYAVDVIGPDGTRVAGASVLARLVEPAPVDLIPGGSTSTVGPPDFRDVDDTGPDGTAHLSLLAAQSATITVTPPADGGLAAKTVTGAAVADHGHIVVTLDRPVSLSGVVRGLDGLPIAGVAVGLSGPGGGLDATSGADGSFSVLVSPPGVYTLGVGRGVNDQTLPFVFRVGGEEVDLSQGSVVADLTVPLLDFEVEVLGPDGSPVVGARVETRLVGPAPVDLVPGGSTSVVGPPDLRDVDDTGPDGVARQVLLAGESATITVMPPANSALTQQTVTAVPVTDGSRTVIALQPQVVLSSIAVAPSSISVPKGVTQQFTATGRYSDGSTADLTSSSVWSSSNSAVATIDATGRAATVGVGTATMTATVGSVSGSASLVVAAPELVSVTVSPGSAAVPKGATLQFTAVGTYTDGATSDLSSSATWSSTNTAVAAVDGSGRITALAIGTTTVRAAVGSHTGTVDVTVTKIPTTLTAPPAMRQSLGAVERITFTVRLLSAVDGQPLANRAITVIAPGGRTCSASTDASGYAICRINYVRTNVPPNSTYTASFAGTADYQAATVAGSIP
jgi:hypothetical protein